MCDGYVIIDRGGIPHTVGKWQAAVQVLHALTLEENTVIEALKAELTLEQLTAIEASRKPQWLQSYTIITTEANELMSCSETPSHVGRFRLLTVSSCPAFERGSTIPCMRVLAVSCPCVRCHGRLMWRYMPSTLCISVHDLDLGLSQKLDRSKVL
jgi:hypothetical protein